jgi:hypothetical protein
VSTIRPLAGLVRRLKPSGRVAVLCCVVGLTGVLSLAGCSSKKTADTSAVAAAETTIVGETSPASETTVVASAETTVAAVEASGVSSEPSTVPLLGSDASVADSVPSDSAPSAAPATPTSVDPQAAMEAAIVTGMSSQLGVTDPKQLACVGEAVKGADFAKPESQGKILRSVIKCAPDVMAVSGAKSLRESNPSVTEKQSICIVKATFDVLGNMADSELVAAMSSSKLGPAVVDATLAKAKGCGLTEAEIRKALQQ